MDGAAGARGTNELHPRSYPGQRMWAESVASLRLETMPHGWVPEEYLGVDLVVQRTLGIAFIVTAGDGATGDDRYVPQVRYERRDVIRGLVNGALDHLFGRAEAQRWRVWFVLHYLAAGGLRAELAEPRWVDRGGWVSGWKERILIPDAVFGSPTRRTTSGDNPPVVDVSVERRAG